ncbi:Ltp family lipoprotein [Zhihengliuella halotolerans]|uniref:Ltp family lipoprotein n=1 Tax=Zhihengliuella halotolerans TaxID=370736 RepID=UPI001C664143|nr:Ltp family lipoprotein [Zhihengliuella halotolerans]
MAEDSAQRPELQGKQAHQGLTPRRRRVPFLAGAAMVFVAVGLAGCGGADPTSVDSAPGSHAEESVTLFDENASAEAAAEEEEATESDERAEAAAAEAEAEAQAEAEAEAQAKKEAEAEAEAEAKAKAEKTAKAEAEAEAEAEAGTVSQRNALRSAQNYLDFAAFSRTGLIEQLEFEDYSTGDATWAVDRVEVDWNEQAAESAENYLDFMAFSRQGLIDQLLFEGFTQKQATYGVDQTGL